MNVSTLTNDIPRPVVYITPNTQEISHKLLAYIGRPIGLSQTQGIIILFATRDTPTCHISFVLTQIFISNGSV